MPSGNDDFPEFFTAVIRSAAHLNPFIERCLLFTDHCSIYLGLCVDQSAVLQFLCDKGSGVASPWNVGLGLPELDPTSRVRR
jgi:hypothetical protein